jgi:hypothetical protein
MESRWEIESSIRSLIKRKIQIENENFNIAKIKLSSFLCVAFSNGKCYFNTAFEEKI